MEFFAISNGIPVHISDTKKGEKTIILLHGYLETLYIYSEFQELLSKRYRVISIDLPGHGLSGSSKEVNSMEFSAKVVAGVLDVCKVEKAFVAGHSMGGYIAQNCMKLFPDLFEGLILLNSTPYADTDEKKKLREKEIEVILQANLGKITAISIPQMFSPDNLRLFDDKIEETIEIAETHDPNGIVSCLKGMMQRDDNLQFLKSLDKLLLVFGDKDKYISNEVRDGIIKELPNAVSVIIPSSGHCSFVEQPQLVEEAMASFIG
jgi:Predicted hydrolases or acyltransferases (alpha/beta hydrolase superfamily)